MYSWPFYVLSLITPLWNCLYVGWVSIIYIVLIESQQGLILLWLCSLWVYANIFSCPESLARKNTNTRRYLFKSRIIRLWKSEDIRRLKDGREKSLSFGRSGWWFVGMWSCGFLRATLMSFSSRGRGPSLSIASCRTDRFSKSRIDKKLKWLQTAVPTLFFIFPLQAILLTMF